MKSIILFILHVLILSQTIGQSNLEAIKSKWKQKKYDEVIDLGSKYRETLQGRGIPALDYMILSSICMKSDPRSDACIEIKEILKDYYIGLFKKDYELMEAGFDHICVENQDPDFTVSDKLPIRQYAHSQRSASTSSKFKTYMLVGEGLKKNGILEKIDAREISQIIDAKKYEKDSLQRLNDNLINSYLKRRITKTDTAGIKKAVLRFGNNSKYWASDNFLVISSKVNNTSLKEVALNMEKVLHFFIKTYQLESPKEYIVIYLVNNYLDVRSNIQRLYSTRINFDPLGFSNFYDNSMVAWISNENTVGTLKHELIHLLLKSKFNLVPEWFEEGLACLYEESIFDTSLNLLGKQNWRGILLKEPPISYSLSDLFANRDIDFNTSDLIMLREKYKKEIERVSQGDRNLKWLYDDHHKELDVVLTAFLTNRVALYKDALSRYFLLYLQDNNQLLELYQALLQRDSTVLDIANYRSLESLILGVCKKTSASRLQDDFSIWLNAIY